VTTVNQADNYQTDPAAFVDRFLPRNEQGGRGRSATPAARACVRAQVRRDRPTARPPVCLVELKKSGKTLLLAALGLWWAATRRGTT